MGRAAWVLFLAIGVIILAGCSRPLVGGLVRSPAGKFFAEVNIRGDRGQPYREPSYKSVEVLIRRGFERDSAILFRKEYEILACSLDWDAHWSTEDDVTIKFYDYGEGVSLWEGHENALPERYVSTLRLVRTLSTGDFEEAADPTPTTGRRAGL